MRSILLLLPCAAAFVTPRRRLPALQRGAPLDELEATESGGPLAWFLRRDNPLYVSVPSSAATTLVAEDAVSYTHLTLPTKA